MNTSFFKTLLFFCLTVVFFASCDKDFNEIGADIIGDDHFNFDLYDSATVIAFNQKVGTVQTNNLPINSLGYYNNPVFGKTKSSFVTQLQLASVNPTFGVNPTVKNVVLTIPYFSTKEKTDDNGNGVYKLDSIYGNSKIKLDIYASNYYLRDVLPPNFSEEQPYFSSQAINNFDNNIADPVRLNNDTNAAQNDEFEFSNKEIVNYKEVEEVGDEPVVESRETPRMKLNLRNDFFQNKFFGAGAAGKLVNSNTFNDYFRGLYFKVGNAASSPDQGSLAMINFSAGTITVTYDIDVQKTIKGPNNTTTTVTEKEEKTLVLNLKGNTVNLFENTDNPNYISNVSNPDQVNGDAKLYLKGGEGSMAIVNLFAPGELESIRENKWQINEASLTFWMDTQSAANAPKPQRIYLYDLDNNIPLADYNLDNSSGATAKNNKLIFGGILLKDSVSGSSLRKYKIRITNHIKNLLDETLEQKNVRLGLVVTESILAANNGNSQLKNPFILPPVATVSEQTVKLVPDMNVANPIGTILFGSNISPEDPNYKYRTKLEIYYTKPD